MQAKLGIRRKSIGTNGQRALRVGVRKVIQAAGNARKLADALGLKRQAVEQWNHVPAKRVLEVEKITKVPRHVQRPDLYPPRR